MCRPARLQVCKGRFFLKLLSSAFSEGCRNFDRDLWDSCEWGTCDESHDYNSSQPSARVGNRSSLLQRAVSGLRVRFHVDSSNLYSFSPGAVRNADRIRSSTPQNRTYRTWGNGLSAIWMVLICVSLDSRLFVLVGFNDGGEAFVTEFCGEDAVDFCGDHAAFLIRLHRRWVFNESFSDDVGMDVFCGGFNESRLGVDGLADDVIPFDSKFLPSNPRAPFLSLFRLEAGAPFALLSSDSSRGWLR